MKRMICAVLLAIAPGTAWAQANQCAVPAVVPRPHVEGPSDREPARQLAIGGYTLALGWSPQYCHTRRTTAADSFQCGGEGPPRFGFTLHGLWPDGVGKPWPQYCQPAALVPDTVVRDTLCATPSPQLIQHEYAKHGTCMKMPPADYFHRSTGLYAGMHYPDMDALSRSRQTVASFSRAFAAANPGLRADMMTLNIDRKGWLEEVWLCLDTAFHPTACRPGGPRDTVAVKIWRGRK